MTRDHAATVKQMIAAVTGAAPDTFGVDLSEDRGVASLEGYAADATVLRRWDIAAATTVGPNDIAQQPSSIPKYLV